MKGKLGSLHNGRLSLGGILDWTLDLTLADSVRDTAAQYKLKGWRLTARSYWLFDVPGQVVVRLYPDNGKGYWEGKGMIISNYKKLFDTLIHEEVVIVGEGIMEGRA